MKGLKGFFFISILCGFTAISSSAQSGNSTTEALLISSDVTFLQSSGGLSENFGYNFNIALGLSKKFNSNYLIGFNAEFLFGNQVKNPADLISSVLTDRGFVLNTTGNYAEVSLYQRGVNATFEIDRIINSFWSANNNSGPTLSLSGGYLFHWMKIDNLGNDAPQLLNEYHKGYDMLQGGLLLGQGIGYTYLAKNRRINFQLSLIIKEFWGVDLRKYHYAGGNTVPENSFTLFYGIKAGWILPIYRKSSNPYYYN